MRYHFVVNPVAGRGTSVALIGAVAEALRAAGDEVTSYVTTAAGDAGRHAGELEEDALDRLVVVGGDGTLREIINGRDVIPWPVGIVPMGTANIIAREARMPLDRKAAHLAQALRKATPWQVDLIVLKRGAEGEERALANVGAGVDADIVHTISALRASADGAGGYSRWVRPMWRTLCSFSFPRLRVTVDGRRTYAAAACTVQNARNYGGVFELSPDAALDSGGLEVVLLRARTNRDLFRILFASWFRRAPLQNDVQIISGRHVRIESTEPVRLQADGDPAGRTDVELELLPGALTLLRA